eukprot:s4382_g6.t1
MTITTSLRLTSEEIFEKIKKDPATVKISHSSILLGFVAAGGFTIRTLLAATMVGSAAAAYNNEYDMADGRHMTADANASEERYTGVYMMTFVTVVAAIAGAQAHQGAKTTAG